MTEQLVKLRETIMPTDGRDAIRRKPNNYNFPTSDGAKLFPMDTLGTSETWSVVTPMIEPHVESTQHHWTSSSQLLVAIRRRCASAVKSGALRVTAWCSSSSSHVEGGLDTCHNDELLHEFRCHLLFGPRRGTGGRSWHLEVGSFETWP